MTTMEQELPLRDIHLPPEPALWPPAAGWWWSLAALLALIVLATLLIRWLLPRWREHRRRAQRIQLWQETLARVDDPSLRLQSALELTRRCALQDRADSARLTPQQWLDLLLADANVPEGLDLAEAIRRLPYEKAPAPAEVDLLIDLLRRRSLQGF